MSELFGGAILSSFFQSLFDRIESDEVIDFFQGKKQLKLLEKLKIALISVNAVLDDAETKQFRNSSVKHWLKGLKDAAEDAENLLDEILTDALEEKILSTESETTSRKRKLSFLFSAIFDSRGRDRKAKIEEILGRLECFASQRDILGLKEIVGERLLRRLPSTSLIEDSKVYGRSEDKDSLKKLVLSDGSTAISVIPIVGMGGVGKTTLAQAIFNDDEVKERFEFKAWVCVSEEFDVCRLTKTVLEAVAGQASDTVDLNSLQVRLKENLKDKKFLVVLDDVWNENYVDWDLLRRPFQDGANGSKIIVTSRSEKVASVMGTSPTHYLKELSNEDCWVLFAKHASGNGDFTKDAKLEAIGKEIVRKCKGLPLAAKTLGGLLRSTLDVGEWERVLRSDIWDFTDEESNILPALRVSYHYLPSHLKRCFAYCSMFPKDYEFDKEKLILLWMAENILSHSNENKKMEDVGNEHFNDLLSRSFFQKMSNKYKSWFVMHDLMVDLAKFVSDNRFSLGGDESSSESEIKVRNFVYYKDEHDSYKRFNRVLESTHLRTFLPLVKHFNGNIPERVVHDLLLKCKCLRSLSLHGYLNIRELPYSIGELKHLRYLDLSSTSISQLPESVCGLYNLQTLSLLDCINLTSLPRNMHRLVNLRHLYISKSCIEMPPKMSKLKNLQTLNIFIVGKDDETRICELRELSKIKGSLCIKKLSNVMNPRDAFEAKLMDKKFLRELLLDWGDDEDTKDTRHERIILENLVPSTTLECLEISHYRGTSFPNWVGDSLHCNIVDMKLLNLKYCTSLPPLGQIASLKTLTIEGFLALETVDHRFYGSYNSSSVTPFQSLKYLKFRDMSIWHEWLPTQAKDCGAFPKLYTLLIRYCPKFTGSLPQSFPSLKWLSIDGCRVINCSLPKMPVLQSLKLIDCEHLLYQKLPSTVLSLKIGNCGKSLESLAETLMSTGTCLEHLEIGDCSFLTTLGTLPLSLKCLLIRNCGKLEFPLPHSHKSLKTLEISNSCNYVQCFTMSSFINLTSLLILGWNNLLSVSLLDMAALSVLRIDSCPNFTSFPSKGLSALKLTSFGITNCAKFKLLPEKMCVLFPSLTLLMIVGCPEIESFPEAGLPSNLRTIIIGNCAKLSISCSSLNLKGLTNLVEFIITGFSETRCFPEEGLLPNSINSLVIRGLSCLETVDSNGFQQLTSLKKLKIEDCDNLRTIPVEGLPNSLEVLIINNCPILEQKQKLKECLNGIIFMR